MTDLKLLGLEPTIFDNKLTTVRQELASIREELIVKNKEIDRLNQELRSKNHDSRKTVQVYETVSESRF